MIKLSERMMMAANMVRHGSRIADIGTDHAYLPVYLIEKGIASEALACDVRRGPLSNAQKTVELFGIQDKITLRLSDGFDEIEPFEADDFIMCGMGGTLMAELVSRAYWLKDPSKKLILQPQSHSEDIRKFLVENGFAILCEDACTDDGKLYSALSAQYTGEKQDVDEAYYYCGKLAECQKPEAKQILLKTLERLKIKLDAAEKHGTDEEYQRLKSITVRMEAVINGR